MKGDFDTGKSLQELELHDWGEPNYDSYLVETCNRLRRKPLNQFTVEDLRIMIGQQIGLPYLIPQAFERLEWDPLSEGNHYPGDLLAMVLKVDETYWANNHELLERLRSVIVRLKNALYSFDANQRQTVQTLLLEAPASLTSI